MAFKPHSSARTADIRRGDTLEEIASREREQGNDITADDIARFNWGAEEPEHIQELMRDELGATERRAPHEFVLSPDCSGRGELRIPEPFRAEGLATNREHRLRVRRKRCPKQFLACSGVPTLGFDFDSSFLRPEAKEALKDVQHMASAYPEAMLFVFGHTDAVGDPLYNKKLSERRAWSVYSFLIKDPSAWETLYSHHDEDWGLATVQEILAHLGHDPGGVDGDMGPLTRAAMREFLDLPDGAPVTNDAAFRARLFEAYMSGPDDASVAADRFCGDGFMGCGEFNLGKAQEEKSPDNRRVTVFAFHKDRLPNFPCAFADLGPCREHISEGSPRYNPGFSCSFYDTMAEPCWAENEHHSVSLLIRTYPATSELVHLLMDEYELRSKDGKLDEARKAMSASTVDEKYVALRWEHVRAHMVLTLVQKRGDGERVILSEVPFTQLRTDGEVARNDATEDLQPPPPAPPGGQTEGPETEDDEAWNDGPPPRPAWEGEY